ncbi:undecaprenyl-diphosphate phosphatase [Nibricoccus sp. IMCC34717]|uniref:undecaprenyl-diphosphate phosphatase n=1 Tax=Nibricoccus sp. IMCC34717 TaxID=3034021 RepID=UPI00384CF46A
MRHLLKLACLLLAFLAASASRAEEATPAPEETAAPAPVSPAPAAPAPAAAPARTLGTRDVIVLGIVEGITEFLPVSSTGHLIIANHALGLESDEPLRDANGAIRWYKHPSPKHPDGVPLTLSELADSYVVIIQIGAIAAVLFLYTSQFLAMARGLVGQNTQGLRLLRNVLIAFLPCVVIGLKTHEWIETNLFSIAAVAIAGISGAVLMICAERWRRQNAAAGTPRLEPSELSVRQALSIGFMQCLALWPGTSRSMVTMVGGYFCGLAPAKAAEFAFLVGLPTLAGAAALKSYQVGPQLLEVFGWQPLLLGIAVAAVSAFLAVKLFVSYLTRHGLVPFAIYRLLLATVLLSWFYL